MLALTSTIAAALAERLGKRFLPLAMLFRLSLVFPDRAPSRFAMARGAGNVRVLETRIREARENGVDPTPARAAKQILSLVAALSAHDRKTRGHSERVRAFTDLVATQLRMPEDDRDRLRWAALLHDIGKLRVPAKVLNKPGRPEPHEWETLKGHPAAGARLAAPLLAWLGPCGAAIEQHHERFDGDGYPRGLAGDEISLAARVVAVADSFEVMTAARSYKKPMSVPAARRELAACAGGQFDPAIVRAFLNVSLGRLWWTVGPASWAGVLPVLGPAQRRAVSSPVRRRAPPPRSRSASPGSCRSPEGRRRGRAGSRRGACRFRPGRRRNDGGGRGAWRSRRGSGRREGEPERTARGAAPGDEGDGDPGGAVDPDDPRLEVPADPVADAVDRVDRVADGAVDTVGDVVDGVTETVDGVADGATDLVDGVVGGSIASDVLDEPVDDVTDLLGGLLDGSIGAAPGGVSPGRLG